MNSYLNLTSKLCQSNRLQLSRFAGHTHTCHARVYAVGKRLDKSQYVHVFACVLMACVGAVYGNVIINGHSLLWLLLFIDSADKWLLLWRVINHWKFTKRYDWSCIRLSGRTRTPRTKGTEQGPGLDATRMRGLSPAPSPQVSFHLYKADSSWIVVGQLSLWIPLCRSAHMRSADYMKPAECEMHFCYRSYFSKSNFWASWCKDAAERRDGFYRTPVLAEPLKYQKMGGLI